MDGQQPVLLFDLESNGLLDTLTKIHVLVIKEVPSGKRWVCSNGPLADAPVEWGVEKLLAHNMVGGIIAGHNVIKFDIPAIAKLFPWFAPNMGNVRDTLVLTRLLFADIADSDVGRMQSGKLPKHLFKKHSLEAWGFRLGVLKDEYAGDPSIADEKERKERKWESWNQTMEDYCVQDVEATEALWNKCHTKIEGPFFKPLKKAPEPFSVASVELEHRVACIIANQERYGFGFDKDGATKLYAELVREKLKIEAELKEVFLPRYFKDGKELIPKRDNKKSGYTEGCPLQKIKLVEFNPGSRQHIAIWLKALHGWEPTEYTESGEAKVDETVLSKLPYKEAKVFTLYLTITKRLGQLAEGKEAWLRHEKNGRIHGSMVTNGAVTGRATHSNPNIGQVPSVSVGKDGHPIMGLLGGWGYECRSLFRPPLPGLVQVGIDMSGVELRCLAHYMARYDAGEYANIVVNGDVHSANQKAAKLATRALAKTFIYAFLYGAGDKKIGSIVGSDGDAGARLKAQFLKGLPALGKLIDAVKKAARRGYLKGLDGRIIQVRHAHAALNTLLQSAGAILSKQWQVIFHDKLKAAGLDECVSQMAWVHDEIQLACPPEVAEQVGQMAVDAIKEAGEYFNFRCPLTGEFKIGKTWAECH